MNKFKVILLLGLLILLSGCGLQETPEVTKESPRKVQVYISGSRFDLEAKNIIYYPGYSKAVTIIEGRTKEGKQIYIKSDNLVIVYD